MNKDDLKCPYCGFESDISDFPDLFYEGCEEIEQYKLQRELQEKGYNIVTCGDCGCAFIQKLTMRTGEEVYYALEELKDYSYKLYCRYKLCDEEMNFTIRKLEEVWADFANSKGAENEQ